MPAYAGKDLLLQVNTTGVTYVTIGGLRTKSIDINGEMIDITNSDSTGLWREALGTYGVRSMSLSGSGVFLDDAAINKVVTNMMTTTAVYNFKIVVAGLGTFDGSFVYTKLTMAGNHNGEETYDVSLESAGAITFTAS